VREIDETWSTSALIEAAYIERHEQDDDGPCPATVALIERGSREVFDAASTLCTSLDARWRSLGANILGELGTPERTYPEECCDILIGLLRDPSEEVVISAVYALGHLGNHRCDADLLALKDHPEPIVRKGVAFSLMGTTLPAAVPALLQLMEDPYVPARDWATTTLAAAECFDGPEIREALMKRATVDEDDITRGEALHGLARRGDRRAASVVATELARSGARSWAFEDAAKACLGLDEDTSVEPEELISALRAARH
jgi:HEAT repeat protein